MKKKTKAKTKPKKKFTKKGVSVTPILFEQNDMPDDLKIKYGLKVTIDWDTFFGWFGKLFSRRKK